LRELRECPRWVAGEQIVLGVAGERRRLRHRSGAVRDDRVLHDVSWHGDEQVAFASALVEVPLTDELTSPSRTNAETGSRIEPSLFQ